MIYVSYTKKYSCLLMGQNTNITIAFQNEKIAKYAAERKWKIAKRYSDNRKTSNENTGFSKLKEDGISKKFDCVIFYSIYRFGSSVLHAYDLLKRVFYPGGIHFAVVEDNFCSADFSSREVYDYLEKKRTEYYKLHARETTGVKLEGRVYEKYGYFFADGSQTPTIDEQAARSIKKVFELVCGGNTLQQTAQLMNEYGFEPPHLYMKRLNINRRYGAQSGWSASQVGYIIRNPLYKGEWHRSLNCEKVVVQCPPIVSAEQYDTAQRLCSSRKRFDKAKHTASGNFMAGMLHDFDTGHPIYHYFAHANGERIFKLKYPKPANVSYPRMSIGYDEVESKLRVLLNEQCERAKRVAELIDSPAFCEYREVALAAVREKANQVFESMKITESDYRSGSSKKDEIEAIQKQNDSELQAYLLQFDQTDKLLSLENPWLKLYADMSLPEKLTSAVMRKYIAAASCEKFEKIRIEPRESNAFLPIFEEMLLRQAAEE